MICAYYEIFKTKPVLNFSNADIEAWNNQLEKRDVPLINEMRNSYMSVYPYLHYYTCFQEDKDGISRIIIPSKKNSERDDE